MTRKLGSRVLAVAVAVAMTLIAASGCTSDAGGGGTAADTTAPAQPPVPIRIGTLPTEDTLPLWVAEREGLFDEAGLPSVEIVTFQAAQERDAAFTAGAIDAFMGDILAAAQLEAGGVPVTIATVMLGADAQEGRFGIAVKPGSDAATLADLAGKPIGTSSATIQEYVLDGLMRQAGVPPDKVVKEEVKKVPVRFQLLMEGKLEAAALPEPFLSLTEVQGAKVLADDTVGENLSQTVLVVSDAYQREPGGVETVDRVLGAWDAAVELVDSEPDAWRQLLVEKARLPEPLKDSYRVNVYPSQQVPTEEQVSAVLDWMQAEGLLKEGISYRDLTILRP